MCTHRNGSKSERSTRDLNPQPLPPEGNALSIELIDHNNPRLFTKYRFIIIKMKTNF